MAADNNGLNNIYQELDDHEYYSTYFYPYQNYNTQQTSYPYQSYYNTQQASYPYQSSHTQQTSYPYQSYYNTQQASYPYQSSHTQQASSSYRSYHTQQPPYPYQSNNTRQVSSVSSPYQIQRYHTQQASYPHQSYHIQQLSSPYRSYHAHQVSSPYVQLTPQQQQQQQRQRYLQQEKQQEQWKRIERDILDLFNDDVPQVKERDDRQLAPVLVETDNSPLVPERLVSFLKSDNSFLTPWKWNPDGRRGRDESSSTSGQIRIEPGSFFSDNNILFRLADELKSRKLSGTDIQDVKNEDQSEQVSEEKSGNLSEVEKGGNLSGTDIEDVKNEDQSEQVSDEKIGNLSETVIVSDDSSDNRPVETDIEQASDVLLLDQNLPRADQGGGTRWPKTFASLFQK